MSKLLTIFLLLFSFTSFAQQKKLSTINCDERFFVLYRDTAYDDKDFPDKYKYYICFEEGFNDTLEIYLNGFLIGTGFYKTDPSLGSAGTKVSFNIKRNIKKYIKNIKKNIRKNIKNNFNLNITLLIILKGASRNHCLEFSIDTRFRIIYISFSEDNWVVTYSNKFTIYE